MTQRKSKQVKAPVTHAEYERALAEYASTTSSIAKINAAIEVRVNKIREEKQQELNMLVAQQNEAFDNVQRYVEENEESMFKDKKKSIETIFGVLGFRTGQPSLKTIAKGLTWEMVVENLKSMKLKNFIRTKEEVDKEGLLNARNDKKVADKFQQIGVKVVQAETFYIDLKEEGEKVEK
ncbi:MAG: host-nuclease inhibitor Gam family protein [Flavipsychrobacter sp.]